MLVKTIVLTGAILGGCASGPPYPLRDERLTLCELRDASDVYEGRTVVVEGVYETDRMEISFLADPTCRGMVISPYFSRALESMSIRTFNTAVAGDIADLSSRQFRVEMRGVVGKIERDGTLRFDVTEVISFERLDVTP